MHSPSAFTPASVAKIAGSAALAGLLAALLGACASTNTSAPAPAAAKPAATAAAPAAASTAAPAATAAKPAAPAATTAATPVAATIDFNKQVQPIFAQYCYQCHGATRQSGRVRWDTPAVLQRPGLVTPGNPDGSSLLTLIAPGSRGHMPPNNQPQPTAADIAILRQWIAEGAKWPAAPAT